VEEQVEGSEKVDGRIDPVKGEMEMENGGEENTGGAWAGL